MNINKNKTMRVWAFPSFYPYDYPGMSFLGTFAHFQYKGLIEAGADLKVVMPVEWAPPAPFSKLYKNWENSREIGYPKRRVYDGVIVHHPRIPNMRPNRIFSKPYGEKYIETIVDFFLHNKIKLDPANDIFYSQWLPDCRYVQQAAKKLGIKSAILAIGDDVIVWPKSNTHNYEAFKDLLLHADLRLANADYLMREANNIINERLPYKVVYFGVDYNLFKPASAEADRLTLRTKYNIPNGKIVIATVATALVRKGWLDLFDALVEVKKNNNNFVLAAVHAGMKDFDMLDEIQKRGLTDIFVNIGEVPPASLNEIYNAADIFCLPSHWEGLATVVIEAMSSGLPVITTDICGHPEAIKHGVTGILVQAKQPQALAHELLSVINDEVKRKRLGENARTFIVNQWGSFADNAAKLKNMLEQTLKEQ